MNESELRQLLLGFQCEDPPSEFFELPLERRQWLVSWIRSVIVPAKSVSKRLGDSYTLKHWLENDQACKHAQIWKVEGGFYVTNGQFKGAMIAAGFMPISPDSRVHKYKAKLAPEIAKRNQSYRLSSSTAKFHMRVKWGIESY